jgi:hypothetical protein
VISGNGTGATIMSKSTFRCVNCFIGGLLQGGQHSVLFLVDSELVGSFLLNTKSLLRLRNTDQTANPDGNEFNNDSQLQADRVSSVLGPSIFSIFSSGFLDLVGARMATHDGDMTCESGSDVFCADPTNQIIGGGTSDCSSCMP